MSAISAGYSASKKKIAGRLIIYMINYIYKYYFAGCWPANNCKKLLAVGRLAVIYLQGACNAAHNQHGRINGL